MTLTRNHKIILAVAIAAALLGGFWFQVLAPKRAEAHDLDTQIAAKQSQAPRAQTQLATYGEGARLLQGHLRQASSASARPRRPTTTSAR